MGQTSQVDNSIYDQYKDRWYTAYDDPIALLRAENRAKTPWILARIQEYFGFKAEVLDVGCGGGFLTNEMARKGLAVTGVDVSGESLKVAHAHDETGTVKYQVADAYKLPFADNSFDVVTAMDFLEHVEDPKACIAEFSRVLKPGGLFFFHTFNRNPLTYLVVIKLVEWLVKNTPKNMHILRLFIKPSEMQKYCKAVHLHPYEWTGIRPVFSSIPISRIFTGIVPESLRFTLTKSLLLSYMGVARKTM